MYIADPTKPRAQNALGWYHFQPAPSLMIGTALLLVTICLGFPAQVNILVGILSGLGFAVINMLSIATYRRRGFIISVPKALAEGYEAAQETAHKAHCEARAETFKLWALMNRLGEDEALEQMRTYLSSHGQS